MRQKFRSKQKLWSVNTIVSALFSYCAFFRVRFFPVRLFPVRFYPRSHRTHTRQLILYSLTAQSDLRCYNCRWMSGRKLWWQQQVVRKTRTIATHLGMQQRRHLLCAAKRIVRNHHCSYRARAVAGLQKSSRQLKTVKTAAPQSSRPMKPFNI